MNYSIRTLLPLVLLSALAGNSINAMNQKVIHGKNISNNELVLGIKDLPKDIKQYILYLLFQNFIWDYKLCTTMDLGYNPFSVVFSPNGETILTGSDTGIAWVWDAKTGNALRTFTFAGNHAHTGVVSSVAVSPDGKTCMAGLDAGIACILDYEEGNLLRAFMGHTLGITSVAFSSDGERVATGSFDNTACVWNSKTKERITLLEMDKAESFFSSSRLLKTLASRFVKQKNFVCSVAFSLDGETCMTGCSNAVAYTWNAETGELLHSFKGHTGPINSIAFNPDGKTVVTGSDDRTACVWNSQTGELVRIFKGHKKGINSVACSPKGEIVFTGSSDGTACMWDVHSGELLRRFTVYTFVDPDEERALPELGNEIARRWNFETKEWEGLTGCVYSVAFSPDRETCLLTTGSGGVGSGDVTISILKKTYDFTCLSKERKEIIFKQILPFYPLLETTSDLPAHISESSEEIESESATDTDSDREGECRIS